PASWADFAVPDLDCGPLAMARLLCSPGLRWRYYAGLCDAASAARTQAIQVQGYGRRQYAQASGVSGKGPVGSVPGSTADASEGSVALSAGPPPPSQAAS